MTPLNIYDQTLWRQGLHPAEQAHTRRSHRATTL